MSLRVKQIEAGKWELMISDVPEFVKPLKCAPDALEEELFFGTWLVVAFSVASVTDRRSVYAAIDCVTQLSGRINLGIRPYEDYQENAKWWPTGVDIRLPSSGGSQMKVMDEEAGLAVHIFEGTSNSPIWLLMKNGEILYGGFGPRTAEQLSEIFKINVSVESKWLDP
jgi:hypothetical protein